VPPVFQVLLHRGVARDDAERTFNMGIGMIAVVADPAPAVALLASRGVPAWVCGTVRERTPEDVSDAPAKGGRGGTVTLLG
jgi:phosphoribosylformylglycinamidine cyclo-ligase